MSRVKRLTDFFFSEILGKCFEKKLTAKFTESIDQYLEELLDQRLIIIERETSGSPAQMERHVSALEPLFAEYASEPEEPPDDEPVPRLLLAELTHRCPLRCPYCSNPTTLIRSAEEVATEEWIRCFNEAADLGVLHLGLSGGEPLLRRDLPELVTAARKAGLYTNLITSGIGLTPAKAQQLADAGLDSIQLSFQAEQKELADEVAGLNGAHELKQEAARVINELGFPLALNIVLHQRNIGDLEQIIALAEAWGAQHLELANVQFYGWAFKNRDRLLPSRAQLQIAETIVQSSRRRLRDKMEIIYVASDYYTGLPKPCMQGWGRQYITINPGGQVLPCPTAGEISGMEFDNISGNSLAEIWKNSKAFNRFRGTDWMPEPCRSCEFRFLEDYGGCRCQAALIAGNAAYTDPACAKSPYRNKLTEFLDSQRPGTSTEDKPFDYRSSSLLTDRK